MSTSVFEAASSGDVDYIKANKSAIKERNERGWTPLHFAARFGQLQVATWLQQEAPELLTVTNGEGKTAAELAQFWGHDQVSQLLTPPSAAATDNGDTGSNNNDTEVTIVKNHTNLFAGSPLNRYGWYRTEQQQLDRLLRASNARFILFSNLDPLFDDQDDKNLKLYFADYKQVATLTDSGSPPTLVFLGIDERNKQEQKEDAAVEGIPYWALDVTLKENEHKDALTRLHQDLEAKKLSFSSALPLAFRLDQDSAAFLSQARAMMDWHTRNKYCPGCGKPVISKEAGHKLVCSSKDITECISHKGLHNFAYPRTDAVVIVCIVHPTEDKILLGRQKRWPARMFSCIAGFVEPGESIEEAVRREALEETGIQVDHVAYHSTQPWPFPNSLMFGFLASATTTDVKMEDKELESARWFSRSDVLGALKGSGGIFTLPPKLAIAHQLIHAWATNTTLRQNAKI